MATIKYTPATSLTKYLKLIKVGESAIIPLNLVKEPLIRSKCSRLKESGLVFKVSVIGFSDHATVTRLK